MLAIDLGPGIAIIDDDTAQCQSSRRTAGQDRSDGSVINGAPLFSARQVAIASCGSLARFTFGMPAFRACHMS
jgi:hypothetical protein